MIVTSSCWSRAAVVITYALLDGTVMQSIQLLRTLKDQSKVESELWSSLTYPFKVQSFLFLNIRNIAPGIEYSDKFFLAWPLADDCDCPPLNTLGKSLITN
jgi:hypothetical protein